MSEYAGRLVLVKIDTGATGTGGATATWTTIGQQRGGSFGRTTETADATHKDDSPWMSYVATRIGWTVSVEGVLDPSDTAWAKLLTQYAAAASVYVQVNAYAGGSIPSGEYKEGEAFITDLSYEFADSDVVQYTAEFQGSGALTTSSIYS